MFVKWPNYFEILREATKFEFIKQIPHIIGAIDCIYVEIKAPRKLPNEKTKAWNCASKNSERRQTYDGRVIEEISDIDEVHVCEDRRNKLIDDMTQNNIL